MLMNILITEKNINRKLECWNASEFRINMIEINKDLLINFECH